VTPWQSAITYNPLFFPASTLQDAHDPHVSHALQVLRALATDDYTAFFRLYRIAPAMGRALMDMHVQELRFSTLCLFVASFKPTLEVSFLARVLGFTPPGGGLGAVGAHAADCTPKHPLPGCSEAVYVGRHVPADDVPMGLEACAAWLADCGAVMRGESGVLVLDCKASTGVLHKPEDKTKVAHGDANLAIDDFLKGFDG
jgi:hypothetical protein